MHGEHTEMQRLKQVANQSRPFFFAAFVLPIVLTVPQALLRKYSDGSVQIATPRNCESVELEFQAQKIGSARTHPPPPKRSPPLERATLRLVLLTASRHFCQAKVVGRLAAGARADGALLSGLIVRKVCA